jgi:hypothetical protein
MGEQKIIFPCDEHSKTVEKLTDLNEKYDLFLNILWEIYGTNMNPEYIIDGREFIIT